MAKKIKIKKTGKTVLVQKNKTGAVVIDNRLLFESKIKLADVTSENLGAISNQELSILHARAHQLYEGIRGRLGGVQQKPFVAKAIVAGRCRNIISAGLIKSRMPVYVVSDASAYGLVELGEPVRINVSVVKEASGICDATDIPGFRKGRALFKYEIKSLDSFREPRPIAAPDKDDAVIQAVNLLGVHLKLTLGDLIRSHAIILKELRRRSMVHTDFAEIDIKTKLLRRIDKKMDIFSADDKKLGEFHIKAHKVFKRARETGDQLAIEKAQSLHALTLDLMTEKNIPHLATDDDFDLLNKGFRDALLPSTDSAARLTDKSAAANKITVQEVLQHFESFKLRRPYVCVVGKLAAEGETDGDLDLLIQGAEGMTTEQRTSIEFEMLRMLPEEIQKRTKFHHGQYDGNIAPFVDLFDLTVERINPKSAVTKKTAEEPEEEPVQPATKAVTEKQSGLFMKIPKENKNLEFVVQTHFRGKSVHSDIRMNSADPDLALGWTLNTQKAGSVKEPVLTLAQAKELSPGAYSKIDWKSGDWPKRKTVRGATINAPIRAERKEPSPVAWLKVQGTVEPGTAGATEQYPGVLQIVDKGTVEYGAQKPDMHEYFFDGSALDSRIVFRELNFPISREKFLELINQDDSLRRFMENNIYAENLGDVLANEIEKRTGGKTNKQDESITGDKGWLAIKPDNQIPYVLSAEAINKGWMPPIGYSGLPKAIRDQVPAVLQYWKKKKQAEALKVRNELAKTIKSGDSNIKIETDKATELDADFVLQKQSWKSPVILDGSPFKELWDIRIDIGSPSLLTLRLVGDPLVEESIDAQLKREQDKTRMKLKGTIEPGFPVNPANEPSRMAIVDSGKLSIIESRSGFVKMQFLGKKLKGIWTAVKGDDGWTFEETGATEESEKINIEIAKVHTEKRLVTGVVLKPEDRDAHQDIYSEDVIERAAHDFAAGINKTTAIGLMHSVFDKRLELVESWIVPVDMKLFGQMIKKGTWIITVRVLDDRIWSWIKTGKIKGFSIGGLASAVPG